MSTPAEPAPALQGLFALLARDLDTGPVLHRALVGALVERFDVSEAAAHTALLPYTLHRDLLAGRRNDAVEHWLGQDPTPALYDLARANDEPHSLKMLGLSLDDLHTLVSVTLERLSAPGVSEADLTQLVEDAYHARRPSRHSRRRQLGGTGPHGVLPSTERGVPLDDARAVLIAVHGRGAAADRITRDLEAHLSQREGLCILAPQALDNTWYPRGFTRPPEDNQPHLDSALAVLDAAWQTAVQAVGAERVVLAGFSQGGCLLLGWLRSREVRPAGVFALSAAHYRLGQGYPELPDTVVHVARSQGDPWIPQEVFDQTLSELGPVAPHLSSHVNEGDEHRIFDESGQALQACVSGVLAG